LSITVSGTGVGPGVKSLFLNIVFAFFIDITFSEY